MRLPNVLQRPIRLCVAVVSALALVSIAGCGPSEPKTVGGPAAMRRLTQEQYRNIIADIFGPDIKIVGRMDPDVRKDGLLQIGATEATFTPGSLEQYDVMARGIAAQIMADKNRRAFMPCIPASDTGPDPACAKQVIASVGRMLFRRPLSEKEQQRHLELADASAKNLGSFYQGLETGLASLLVSPDFLFQKDVAEPDSDHPGKFRLTAYAKAARLSFLLWNSAPDDLLLKAAESGELNSKAGLEKQADRMIGSPRLKDGIRGFFDDFLQFSLFDALAKDSTIYPKFSQAVAVDAREQTLRTIVGQLVTEDGDFRDLFTTRKTYLSRTLGMVYRIPVPVDGSDEWMPYEFPAGDPRGGGLLTQLSFTAMYALPGRSSATLRGKAIREVFLCEKVPAPPANVDFSRFENSKDPVRKTARERLALHRSDPACAGCHAFMDPVGLALENFDGLGAFREHENGAKIDAGGVLDGVNFTDAAGLGQAMHDSPQPAACFVNKLFAYGVGHLPTKGEQDWITFLQAEFRADGYKVPQLLKRIVTSEAFYRVNPNAREQPAVQTSAGLTPALAVRGEKS
jgi:hypothetical protein